MAALCIACAGSGCRAATPAFACPTFAPVRSLALLEIYKDAKGSIPDPDAEKKNTELSLGVDQFLRYVEGALDAPKATRDDPAVVCADRNFKAWAAARALTVDPVPYSRQGWMKRGQYLVGLNVLALKFKAVGIAPDRDTLSWLHDLNIKNIEFYEHGTNRGNLRIWAGASAALYAVVDRDPVALEFQDRVWREAMSAIHDDGTIDAEMARGQRALIYHMFSFSATLVLRSARGALGDSVSPADRHRLELLADMIGHSLCDPGSLEPRARAKQEIPGDWAYRIALGYGSDLLNAEWSRCGRPDAATADPTSGGDARHSAAVLSEAPRL